MKYKLTQAELIELVRYEPETGQFYWRGTRRGVEGENSIAGCMNAGGYWQIKVQLSQFSAHRLAWLYVTGQWPSKAIDHINGNKLDNRIVNLREATSRENAINAKTTSVTGYRGVYWKPLHKKYEARIRTVDKRLSLGHFTLAEQAAEAYDMAARQYHGDFAHLNFPNA